MRSYISGLKKKLYLVVANYFRFFANISLRRWNPRIIAITGSVGKTTMLHLAEQQLQGKAHYSHFANSAYGIAFDIVGLRGITKTKFRWVWLFIAVPVKSLFFGHEEQFYVVEIDADRPKETEYIAKWLKPEVTLWVSLGRSHAVNFDMQVSNGEFENVDEAIAHEFSWLPKMTTKFIIYDGENDLIVQSLRGVSAKKQPVDKKLLKSYRVWPDHSEFEFNSGRFNILHPVPKDMYVQLAMLERLAEYLGMPTQHDLSKLEMPPGRNNFFEGKKGVKLIDSSYNAHLISMKSMIEMFDAMQASDKWIVIGDIIELGKSEAEQHKNLGEILANTNFSKYILVGKRMRKYVEPLLNACGKEKITTSFLKTSEAAEFLESNITGSETIMFKGSQYLEMAVERLLLDPSDSEKLPRRETMARKRRNAWGDK